jgi:pSer/pThr/pTyr-binding forkhead associated (FHA) protein
MIKFKITSQSDGPFIFPLKENQTAIIGRSSKSDLRINSPKISGMHCRITLKDNHLEVWDLESTNGTFMNGQKIIKKRMHLYDKVKFGDHALQFDVDSMDSLARQQYLKETEKMEPIKIEGSITKLLRLGTMNRASKRGKRSGGRKSVVINYANPEEARSGYYSHISLIIIIVQMIVIFIYNPQFYTNYTPVEAVSLLVLLFIEYYVLNRVISPSKVDVYVDRDKD